MDEEQLEEPLAELGQELGGVDARGRLAQAAERGVERPGLLEQCCDLLRLRRVAERAQGVELLGGMLTELRVGGRERLRLPAEPEEEGLEAVEVGDRVAQRLDGEREVLRHCVERPLSVGHGCG